MNFDVSLYGTKDQAVRQLRKEVSDVAARSILTTLIENAAGNYVSIEATMTRSPDGRYGTLTITGSFSTQ